METSALQRRVKASDLSLDLLVHNSHVSERDKLGAASQAFEAVLLRQILENAMKPVIKSGLSQGSNAASVYRDMINTQMADSIAKSGQFGLARSLDRDWMKPGDATGKGTPATPTGNPESVAAPAMKPWNADASLKPFLHEPDLKAYIHE